MAFHIVTSRNVRSTSNFSATRGVTLSNSNPTSESNAARLGEQDAKPSERLTRKTIRGLRYGLGEMDGAGFCLSKMSGSFISLKSPGTVNSLSLIGSWLTEVIVLVISVPGVDGLVPGFSAGVSLLRIMRVRIGSPGKSRKSGILVLAASQNSDLMDWSCARIAAPSG